MNTIPLWVPLVIAALGVVGTIVGTIAGVLITQRRSDRREDQAWTRERERERELWAREDQLRTFEQRRESYVAFYEELRDMAGVAFTHGQNQVWGNESRLPDAFGETAYRTLQRLSLFAAPDVMKAADRAYWAASHYGQVDLARHGIEQVDIRMEEQFDTERELFEAIRIDLGVPQGEPLPRPPVPDANS